MSSIVVSGNNSYYQLFVQGNNFTQTHEDVCPPEKIEINISELYSISSYCFHSIIVRRDGLAFAVGDDRGFCIGTKKRKQYTKLNPVEIANNSEPFVSAVCGATFSLYLTTHDTLIFCHGKGNKTPFFFKLHTKTKPVALFGGHQYAAVVDNKGDLFIVTEDIFKSESTQNLYCHFPEQIIDLCCCDDFLIVLTKSGRVFGNRKIRNYSNINNKTNSASLSDSYSNFCDFREIYEFYDLLQSKNEHAIQISGTYNHCFIVTNVGNVFGYGSNFTGQLGIPEDAKGELDTFEKIESFSPEMVVKTSAGANHSLFLTKSGKLLSCGANQHGQLLLNCKSDDNAKVPIETTVTSPSKFGTKNRATFMMSGDSISVVVVNCEPPPFTPNMPINVDKFDVSIVNDPFIALNSSSSRKIAKYVPKVVPTQNVAIHNTTSSSLRNISKVDDDDDDDDFDIDNPFLRSTKPYNFLETAPLSASTSASTPTSKASISKTTFSKTTPSSAMIYDYSKKKANNQNRNSDEPEQGDCDSMKIKTMEKQSFFSKRDNKKSTNELIKEVNYYRKLCRALENEVQSSRDQLAKKRRIDTFLHSNFPSGIDISQLIEVGTIGRGAQAEVKKVQHTKVTFYAKKILHDNCFKANRDFIRECETLMCAKHPCIVKIHAFDFGADVNNDDDDDDDDENPDKVENRPKIIILSYYPYNLNQMIKMLNNTEKVRIFMEILIGMRFINEEKKIIHRDLKPQNILLNKSRHARIGDFGLATSYDQSLTKGVGTMIFMAPEIMNEEKYGLKADQYSMGILLFFILTDGELPKINIKGIVNGKKFAIPEIVNDFGKAMIRKLCEFDPDNRPLFSKIIDEIKEKEYALMGNVDSDNIKERVHHLEDKEINLFEK